MHFNLGRPAGPAPHREKGSCDVRNPSPNDIANARDGRSDAARDTEDRRCRRGRGRAHGRRRSRCAVPRPAGPAVGRRRRSPRRPRRSATCCSTRRSFPTSPLILNPFNDPLNVPEGPRARSRARVQPLGGPAGAGARSAELAAERAPPDLAEQGRVPRPAHLQHRRSWSTPTRSRPRRCCRSTPTASPRSPSTRTGGFAAGVKRTLPPSTIYGFNGTFPGPMINAEYGKPALVRFENQLDENQLGLDRQDFGSPDWSLPDPPAQRAHRARERRQPALLDGCRPPARGLSRPATSSTTST